MAKAELARFVDRYTVEYLRTFPHPIERVWKAIVDPAEIGQWFVPPTRWDLREGGAYRFHDDDMSGAILAYEPPRLIRFQDTTKNGPDAWFQFELEPVEGGPLATSYYDWSSIDPVWKEAGIFPVLSEGALRATLGILARTVTRGDGGGAAV